MKIRWIVALLLSAVALLSCASDDDCFTGDSIEQIKTVNIDNQDHFLFLRVTGFHEKESFYELYATKPTFDKCGKAEPPPVSKAHADKTEGQITKLVIDGNKLEIIFDEAGQNQKIKLKEIPIEIK